MFVRVATVGVCSLLLAQCGQAPSGRVDPKYGVSSSPRLVALGEPVPKGGGKYRVGKPYTIAGKTYEPEENANYTAEGLASWYGDDFHGRATANGEIFDMSSLSAAHPTLPIPSYARITNLSNNKSIIVRVNDRGPYHANRLIDVSVRTAKLLDFYDRGVTRVRVEYVGRAAIDGSDDTKLAATLRSGTPAPGLSEMRVASSRPFIPQAASASRTVPMPAERPYELGHEDTRVAKRQDLRQPVTEVAAISRQPIPPVAAPARAANAAAPKPAAQPTPKGPEADQWERGFASRFAPASNLPSPPAGSTPVSAFAAPPPPNGAVVSGRGLY
ncbi:MAG: septal ring lytic transglycosylase RlpA family protein [Alphaproteobacteria bacterium]|nr:septal ring lytic transglycosylase RlpA family protein [Alphaproteobacteria bacterium]